MKKDYLDSQKNHYFDYNATAPLCQELKQSLPELLTVWGNPSSIHWAGRKPKLLMREARQIFSETLDCHLLEMVFTSGGTESNNSVIQGVFNYHQVHHTGRRHFMCSQVEHPSVIRAMQLIESLGAKVDYIPVLPSGEIDFDFIKSKISSETALISVMLANNETGLIFPVKKMAQLAHEVGAQFHSDCVQAFGKFEFSLRDLDLDFASFSAHKIQALKGCGLMFSKKNSQWIPMMQGGAQERHRRGGTENVLGISAFSLATKHRVGQKDKILHMQNLRNYFENKIQQEISGISITHGNCLRLPNTSSLVIDGTDGESLLMSLDIMGFAVSTGAACSSGSPEPSPVLIAFGLTRDQAQKSLRVSFGWEHTMEEVDDLISALIKVVKRLRSIEGQGDFHG